MSSLGTRYFPGRLSLLVLCVAETIFIAITNGVPLARGYLDHDKYTTKDTFDLTDDMYSKSNSIVVFKLWHCSFRDERYAFGGPCTVAVRTFIVMALILTVTSAVSAVYFMFMQEPDEYRVANSNSFAAPQTSYTTYNNNFAHSADMKVSDVSKGYSSNVKSLANNPLGKHNNMHRPRFDDADAYGSGDNNEGHRHYTWYMTVGTAIIILQALTFLFTLSTTIMLNVHNHRKPKCGPLPMLDSPHPSTGSAMLWATWAAALCVVILLIIPRCCGLHVYDYMRDTCCLCLFNKKTTETENTNSAGSYGGKNSTRSDRIVSQSTTSGEMSAGSGVQSLPDPHMVDRESTYYGNSKVAGNRSFAAAYTASFFIAQPPSSMPGTPLSATRRREVEASRAADADDEHTAVGSTTSGNGTVVNIFVDKDAPPEVRRIPLPDAQAPATYYRVPKVLADGTEAVLSLSLPPQPDDDTASMIQVAMQSYHSRTDRHRDELDGTEAVLSLSAPPLPADLDDEDIWSMCERSAPHSPHSPHSPRSKSRSKSRGKRRKHRSRGKERHGGGGGVSCSSPLTTLPPSTPRVQPQRHRPRSVSDIADELEDDDVDIQPADADMCIGVDPNDQFNGWVAPWADSELSGSV